MTKRIKLVDLIERGIINPPFNIHACFKGHDFEAQIDADGFIILEGKRYTSLSLAAGVIRAKISGKPKDGFTYRRANGWTFWRYKENDKGSLQIDYLRKMI